MRGGKGGEKRLRTERKDKENTERNERMKKEKNILIATVILNFFES